MEENKRPAVLEEWQREPARSAVFDAPTGVARCMFCPSRHLRLSRLRWFDVPKILLFLFPVRCGRCGQRQYTSQLIAALAGTHKIMKSKNRMKRPDPTWAAWTEADRKHAPGLRPITTVMEPKATRLQPIREKDESKKL